MSVGAPVKADRVALSTSGAFSVLTELSLAVVVAIASEADELKARAAGTRRAPRAAGEARQAADRAAANLSILRKCQHPDQDMTKVGACNGYHSQRNRTHAHAYHDSTISEHMYSQRGP